MDNIKKKTVKCSVCGQDIVTRKKHSMGDYPVSHINPQTNDTCHGFFKNGGFAKPQEG